MRYRDRVPLESSAVHRAFDDAGGVLIGKSNLSDLGISPEASSYLGGPTRNPHDLRRTAGGSSGGAAAAVADGMVCFDWGSDIGGSIRMPAAFCGIYGLKLSSETWPISGFFPKVPPTLEWMCGQGPLTRTLGQMRAVLDAAAPTIRTGPERPFSLKGACIWAPDARGAWPDFPGDLVPRLQKAIGPIEQDPGLPSTTRVRNIYNAMWASHLEDLMGSDNLGFWDGLGAIVSSVIFRGSLGDRRIHPSTAEILGLVALGRYTLYRDPRKAEANAQAIRAQITALWDRGLLLVMPVCVYPPPKLGRTNYNGQLLACAVPGNLADATGLSIPFGHFPGGLPRSIQLLGPPGSERLLIDVAERLSL